MYSKCNSQEFVYEKKTNKYIFKPKKGKTNDEYSYDKIEYLDSKTWLVSENGLWGVFSEGNKLILPVNFEKIDHFTENSNLVKMTGIWGNFTNNEFIPLSGKIIFHNPDQIAHLKECENFETNDEFEKCLIQKMYYNLSYPKDAIEKNIEGLMIAALIIDETGNIISTDIKRGLGGGLTEEFERLLKEVLLEWKPAINEGKPVISKKIISIRMRLKG